MITKKLVREAISVRINMQNSLGKTVDLNTLHKDETAQILMKNYVLTNGKPKPNSLCVMFEHSKDAELYDKYYWEVIEEISKKRNEK